MRIYRSDALRNAVVEDHLWCIDVVICNNRALMVAAHLDYEDVYQWLAIRLIRAVTKFEPEKGKLEQYILKQLQFEIDNCKSSQRMYGFTDAPRDLRGMMVSVEQLMEKSPDWETEIVA